MTRRLLYWAVAAAAAATAAIAINLALLGFATSGQEPVGKQSARTTLPRPLRPSLGLRHLPPPPATGLEADD